jgi:hypothetical protein
MAAVGLACCSDHSASPDHRVTAGIIALKTVFHLCDARMAHRIRNALEDALPNAATAITSEFQLIFEGSFGDVSASAAEARRLRDLEGDSTEGANKAKLLQQCSIAFLIAGDYAEAQSCLDRATEIGTKLGLQSLVRGAAQQQAGYCLATGLNTEGEKLCVRYCELDGVAEGVAMRVIERNIARFAILRGDFAEAKRRLGDFRTIWDGDYPREQHFIAEVRASYLMHAEGWVPTNGDMARLLQMYRVSRGSLNADMFVLMLVEAYTLRGARSKAAELGSIYLKRFRRERGMIVPRLREKLEELGVSSNPPD